MLTLLLSRRRALEMQLRRIREREGGSYGWLRTQTIDRYGRMDRRHVAVIVVANRVEDCSQECV